jgi:hypothetical protein
MIDKKLGWVLGFYVKAVFIYFNVEGILLS